MIAAGGSVGVRVGVGEGVSVGAGVWLGIGVLVLVGVGVGLRERAAGKEQLTTSSARTRLVSAALIFISVL
jgi:hypothetical protein